MNHQVPATSAQAERIGLQKKLESGRGSILVVILASAVNLVMVVLSNSYLVFSSFVTLFLATTGAEMYGMTGEVVWPIAFGILGLISLLPYVLCYVFSKKHVGWMIAALVLFGIDTLLLLLLFFGGFDPSMIIDLLVRVWVIVSLSIGIQCSLRLKRLPKETEESEDTLEPQGQDDGFCFSRSITVSREKRFTASLMAVNVCVNGRTVETLKNGESKVISVPAEACTLTVTSPQLEVSNPVQLPEGEEPRSYAVSFKMHLYSSSLQILLEEK